MSAGISPELQHLPADIKFNIFDEGLSIEDLCHLREASKNLRLDVDEFVRHKLNRSNTQGPSMIKNFLATQEKSVTLANAWRILGLFKKAYPSFPLHVSIEKGCQQLDQATMALKEALVLQNRRAFQGLAWQQTAEEIRNWFNNPINHPLLQTVTQLNLQGMGLSLIPLELRFFSNLQSLSLSQNQIVEIPLGTFDNLQRLQWLFLHENQIKAIAVGTFANLLNLQEISLRDNKIEVIPPHIFANLPNLRWLYLGNNDITVIGAETFTNLPDLRVLCLSQNNIRAIPPQTFANLVNLKRLDLRNNQIPAPDRINHAYLGLGPDAVFYVDNPEILLENPIFNLNCSIL